MVWLWSGAATAQEVEGLDPVDPEVEEQVEVEDVAEEPAEAMEGTRIAAVRFRCDLEICQSAEARQSFVALSGLRPGQTFEVRRMEAAHQRLIKTGFFQELIVDRSLSEEGVVIEIEAEGAILIRRIDFEGTSPPPFKSELRNVLMYRPGQVFRDDEERLEAQYRSLIAMFEEEGYFGTTIDLAVQPVEGDPHLVDLVFEVDRGEQRRICEMAFRGIQSIRQAEARELMLSDVSVLGRRIPLFLPVFTTDQFRGGREALIEDYRQRGYYRARVVGQGIQIDEQTQCARLIVDLNEGPHWQVEFEGNQQISDQRLSEAMTFAQTGYVDDAEIRIAQNRIRQVYESRGFPFAEVRGQEMEEDRLNRRLRFDIVEGPQAPIEAIHLHGLSALSEEEALEEFGTRPFGLFDTGGNLQTEQLLRDFEVLEGRLREMGYLQAVVESFRVRLDEGSNGVVVEVEIDEGRATMVRGVELEGVVSVDEGRLRRLKEVSEGDRLSPVNAQADQSRLSQYYGRQGFARAAVTTHCREEGDEEQLCRAPRLAEGCLRSNFDVLSEEGCERVELESGELRWECERRERSERCEFSGGVMGEEVVLHHRITEGPRVRLGQVLLKGNFRTRPRVIFRELEMESGQWLDVQALMEGQGNMRSLGIFDSVSIETIGLEEEELTDRDDDGEDPEASLIVSVEESQSRFLDFRFGVEGRELLDDSRRLLATGEMQYSDRNLFGTGQQLRPRVIAATDTLELRELGRERGGLEGERRGVDYLIGVEVPYTHPRFLRGLLGINELNLTVTPFYILDRLGVATDRVLREEWGLRLDVRKELDAIADRLFLRVGLEAKQASTWTPGDLRVDGERIFSPRRATGKVFPEITFDRRDSPLNPTEGYHVQAQPELVSGDALGEGEALIGDSYGRLSMSGSRFFNLGQSVTLGQGIRGAQIVPVFDRQTLVPPEERFYLGGSGSLRGFSANSLGPVGSAQQPEGGEFLLNYHGELRYPLVEEWSLYGATFFDAGVLVNCVDEEGQRSSSQCYRNAFPEGDRLREVRATAGLGVRYLLVGQIPLLLDYGMVLNRRPGESFGSLHFNLGYTF